MKTQRRKMHQHQHQQQRQQQKHYKDCSQFNIIAKRRNERKKIMFAHVNELFIA